MLVLDWNWREDLNTEQTPEPVFVTEGPAGDLESQFQALLTGHKVESESNFACNALRKEERTRL